MTAWSDSSRPAGRATLAARLVGPRPDPAYLDRLEAAYGLQGRPVRDYALHDEAGCGIPLVGFADPDELPEVCEPSPGVFVWPRRIRRWALGALGAGEGDCDGHL